MALNPKRSNAAVNAAAVAVTSLLDNGYLRIYSGAQPTNADTAVGAQVLLAELRFATPAFGAPTDGVAVADVIPSDTAINATGTAAWFRALKADGTTAVLDGSVGTATSDMIVNSVALSVGAEFAVSAFTYTESKG